MIYRKHGSVARWENGTLIRVSESGAAREEGELFECWPEVWSAAAPAAALDLGSAALPRRVEAVASAVKAAAGAAALHIERLLVMAGLAEHEYDGRTWSDETDRVHLSMTHGHLRVLVDSTARRLGDIAPIADALRRAEPHERVAPKRLRLAPNVAAALLPHLANIIQTAGGVDGYGHPIVEARAPWPNVYRPSYRVRPVRMPLNVRIDCDETEIDADLPRALALLAPVHGRTLRVLVEDKQRVYPATVVVDGIRAAGAERIWYPYGGGSFGAELML